MLPAILGFVSGDATSSVAYQTSSRKRKLFGNIFFLALGFTVTVMILGFIASFIGEAVQPIVRYVQIAAGSVLVILGLRQMNVLSLKFLSRVGHLETAATKQVQSVKAGYIRAFVVGLVLAPGWGTIFLGSILLVVTLNGDIIGNVFKLLFYSLGFSTMLIVTFLFAEPLRFFFKKLGDKVTRLQQIGGALIVFIGVLMVVNRLNWISDLATWSGGQMLRNFLGID